MKTREFLLLGASLLAFSFYSCNNDKEPDFTSKAKYVSFSGSIAGVQTKASGTTWGSGDAIGVYMKTASGNLTAGGLASNVKYTTPGSGVFTAAVAGIELPENGDQVDFIAYYPYLQSLTGLSLPIDVTNQSSLPNIDVLYSNNATGKDKTTASVPLQFTHQLSLLILDISAGDGVATLEGMTMSIANAQVKGSLNLEDGTVTPEAGTARLTLLPVITGKAATMQAILMPGQDLNNTPITFVIGGINYEWTPNSQSVESGKKYSYPIQLTRTGVVLLDPSGTITDWVDGNTGGSTVIVTPKEETEFKADKPAVTLAAAGSSEGIYLTTPNDQAWTATALDSWLTINPASGISSGSITLTAGVNDTGAQRSTTVTITPTGSTTLSAVTVTVTQPAGGGGVPIEFFTEPFSTNTIITTTKVDVYTDYIMGAAGYTFSDPYPDKRADVRSTGTLNPHVWLAANFTSGLLIEGIPEGYTQMTLSYDIATNSAAGANADIIVIKCDNTVIPVDKLIPSQNSYVRVNLIIPNGTRKIEFFSEGTVNTVGMRIDNISISGVR